MAGSSQMLNFRLGLIRTIPILIFVQCNVLSVSYKRRSDLREPEICPQSKRTAPVGYNLFSTNRFQIQTDLKVSWEAHRYWALASIIPTLGFLRTVAMNSIELKVTNNRPLPIIFSQCDVLFFDTNNISTKIGISVPNCEQLPKYTVLPQKTVQIDVEQEEMTVASLKTIKINFRSASQTDLLSQDINIEEDWSLCFSAINR